MEENKKEEKSEKKESIIFTNSMFESFCGNPTNPMSVAIDNVVEKTTDTELRLKLYSLIKLIIGSAEFAAYLLIKQELIEEFTKAQEEKPKKERVPPILNNMPKLVEIMEMKTELKLNKIKFEKDVMPDVPVS